MTIQQSLLLKKYKKLYKDIQTPETIFTKDWIKDTLKKTMEILFDVYPLKNCGKVSIHRFLDNTNQTNEFGEMIQTFQISFYDKAFPYPWLICQFYKQERNVRLFVYDKEQLNARY